MAESRSTPQVSYRHNVADGRHEIGVKIDKLFVPFAALEDARFAQVSERETNRVEADTENGEGES
jgi:hypothetical protein